MAAKSPPKAEPVKEQPGNREYIDLVCYGEDGVTLLERTLEARDFLPKWIVVNGDAYECGLAKVLGFRLMIDCKHLGGPNFSEASEEEG